MLISTGNVGDKGLRYVKVLICLCSRLFRIFWMFFQQICFASSFESNMYSFFEETVFGGYSGQSDQESLGGGTWVGRYIFPKISNFLTSLKLTANFVNNFLLDILSLVKTVCADTRYQEILDTPWSSHPKDSKEWWVKMAYDLFLLFQLV